MTIFYTKGIQVFVTIFYIKSIQVFVTIFYIKGIQVFVSIFPPCAVVFTPPPVLQFVIKNGG